MDGTKIRQLVALGVVALVGGAGCNDSQLAPSPIATDAPIAVIDGQADYSPLDTAVFDGSASHDPDGGELASFDWEVIAKPAGSNASIQYIDDSHVEFFVDFAGDYTIQLTVTDDEGDTGSTTFDFSAVPWQAIHVELAWDVPTSDVDLHLVNVTEGGAFYVSPKDCYYANMNPDWGTAGALGDPSLDIDDVDGYGPENINVDQPENGKQYRVYVHYFSDDGVGSTNATIRIYLSGTLQFEQIRNITDDLVWDVATIDWPTGQITEIGTTFPNGSPF